MNVLRIHFKRSVNVQKVELMMQQKSPNQLLIGALLLFRGTISTSLIFLYRGL